MEVWQLERFQEASKVVPQELLKPSQDLHKKASTTLVPCFDPKNFGEQNHPSNFDALVTLV